MSLTKIASPIVVADQPWEKPFNRVQLFGSVLSPDESPYGDWRMWAIYHAYEIRDQNGALKDRRWSLAMLRADDPAGPWEKDPASARLVDRCDAISLYWDGWGEVFRGYALNPAGGNNRFGTSVDGRNWSWSTLGRFTGSPLSLIRHQPLASGSPFICFGRLEDNSGSFTKRRVGVIESGNFSSWSSAQPIAAFDTQDGGLTQAYNLSAKSYGNKVVGFVPWLTLDQHPGSGGDNSTGDVDSHLVWCEPSGGSIIGATWHKASQPFIPRGTMPSDPDFGCILAAPPVIYDGTVYAFYTAFAGKHGYQPPDASSIMLATMPQSEFDALLV